MSHQVTPRPDAERPPAEQDAQRTSPASVAAGWSRADQWILSSLIVLLVVTQRVGILVGGTSVGVALPLAYVGVVLLLARRRLTVSKVRGELYLVAVAACLAVATIVDIKGQLISITSLWLLLVLYLPWILRVKGPAGQAAVRKAGQVFVRVMLLLSALGIFQLVSQLVGLWQYEDYLAKWLPADLLIPGYNTQIPLAYGLNTFKGNAFVLLEPSILSQFCGLAVVIGLLLRIRPWQILLLVAGLASAVSGTGIILLIGSGVLFLVRSPRSIRPAYLAVIAVAVVAVFLSPIAGFLLDRTGEINQPASSGYARFVAPYTNVLQGLTDDPIRYAIGAGPGNTERLLSSGLDAVLYGILPKLFFEYGIVAGGLFVLFIVLSMLDRTPWRVVPGALVILVFFLQGGLLQPQTAYLAWVFTGLGASDEEPRPHESAPDAPQRSPWRRRTGSRSAGGSRQPVNLG